MIDDRLLIKKIQHLTSENSWVVPEYKRPKWYDFKSKSQIRWMKKHKLPFRLV